MSNWIPVAAALLTAGLHVYSPPVSYSDDAVLFVLILIGLLVVDLVGRDIVLNFTDIKAAQKRNKKRTMKTWLRGLLLVLTVATFLQNPSPVNVGLFFALYFVIFLVINQIVKRSTRVIISNRENPSSPTKLQVTDIDYRRTLAAIDDQ